MGIFEETAAGYAAAMLITKDLCNKKKPLPYLCKGFLPFIIQISI